MLARENGAVMCPQGDLKVGPLTEYDYAGKPDGKIRPLIWERMVSHSIRPDVEDGFLLPHHDGQASRDRQRPAIWCRRRGDGRSSLSKPGGRPTLPPDIECPRHGQAGA